MNKTRPKWENDLKLKFQAGNLCSFGYITPKQFDSIWDRINTGVKGE